MQFVVFQNGVSKKHVIVRSYFISKQIYNHNMDNACKYRMNTTTLRLFYVCDLWVDNLISNKLLKKFMTKE